MPLDKTTLASSIQAAFAAVETNIANGDTASTAQKALATAIANAIDTYTKGATVNVPALGPGTMTVAAAPGPVTGDTSTGSGTLS